MDKRSLLAGLTALPFFATMAHSSGKNSASWRVPAGIKKIRVRSWNPDGSRNLDRTLNVKPGEFFRIDAIEE